MQTTTGTLLDGKVRYTQPARTSPRSSPWARDGARDGVTNEVSNGGGYRTGIEPVLLAASIPAQPGQRVLEAGTGAAAALLCLHARIPGLVGTGIEQDPGMADLARHNIAENHAPCTILTADITTPPALPPFDHVFANPPWHAPAATQPPSAMRSAATHQRPGTLPAWITALATLMAPRATLTLILPAALAAEAIAHLHQAGLPRQVLFPLWPRRGQPAKIILLQAARTPGPTRIAPGLVLHDGNAYTPEAERILRHAAPLPL